MTVFCGGGEFLPYQFLLPIARSQSCKKCQTSYSDRIRSSDNTAGTMFIVYIAVWERRSSTSKLWNHIKLWVDWVFGILFYIELKPFNSDCQTSLPLLLWCGCEVVGTKLEMVRNEIEMWIPNPTVKLHEHNEVQLKHIPSPKSSTQFSLFNNCLHCTVHSDTHLTTSLTPPLQKWQPLKRLQYGEMNQDYS